MPWLIHSPELASFIFESDIVDTLKNALVEANMISRQPKFLVPSKHLARLILLLLIYNLFVRL